MIIKLTLLYCLLIGFSYAELSTLRSVVDELLHKTKNLTTQFKTNTGNAIKKFVNGTKDVLDKVNEGAFNVSKGIISGLTEVIGTPVTLKDLTFNLVTSENVDNAIEIDFYNPGDIWQNESNIYFLIHGWQASKDTEWIQNASKIFLSKQPDAQVVQVDWKKPAKDLYSLSAFETESAGELIGAFIDLLITNYHVPMKNIVIIGHSLGGHIAGWAGKKFQEMNGVKLPRIIALDPAGPLFHLRPDSMKLNKDDAVVVMVIHTDGDKLGYKSACGTIDFFPNGGRDQPGCWDIDLGNLSTYTGPVTCDHSRAWQFFNEAIDVPDSFLSWQCESYKDFRDGKCQNNLIVPMSDIETEEQGEFYLITNYDPPYSIPLNNYETPNKKRRRRTI
ncbi:phospholipase A1-like [Coccinella septempunctata]|uniref:phospholipase A1-like n=1 Tax=Coccinella septempunctata TaxID=41139 RepID=UPI001D093FA2|nr:phospholipase A1-like [Coccinella septempunctata]